MRTKALVICLLALFSLPVLADVEADLRGAVSALEQRDYATAVPLLKAAAKAGPPYAQHKLGVLYERGRGVPRDYELAAAWLRSAAEQGNAQAQNDLGCLYFLGLGVSQDDQKAARWFRKAAEQGNEPAINDLAWIFATSPDETIRDGSEAIRLAEAYLKVHNDNVNGLDTLAAAYAEVGRFKDAVETQKKVLSMMKADDPRLARFQSRLNSYQGNKPWREN